MKFLILFLLFFSVNTYAVDLTDRIGVGYSNAFITQDTPSIQVKYSPTRALSFVAAFGVDTSDDDSNFGFLLKAHKIIFHESNLNFYLGGHAAFVSQETTINVLGVKSSDTDSGFEFGVLCGAEFFIPGLENLGITFEAGLGLTTVGDGVRFKTTAHSPLTAGMIFYF